MMKKKELQKSFLKYTLANIISTLGVSVYILIDTFFISKGMGSDGLTALNICLPVFNLINGLGLMLGMGGGSRFSMMYCRVERQETDRVFSNTVAAAAVVSAGLLLIGLFASGPFTALLGADDGVFEMAHGYLHTVLLFAPAYIMNNILVCFMRNDCAPHLAMAGVLGSSVSNLILDYVFIFRMNMGMTGAALATSIAPLVSIAIMSIHFIRGWNAFSFRWIVPDWKEIRRILPLGLHSFLTEISGGVVIIVFNFVIYRLCGNAGIAAYGIIANMSVVITAIFTGLSSGVQPLFCKYHGAGDSRSVGYLLRLSVVSAMVISAVSYILLYLNEAGLVSIFNQSSDTKLRVIAENGLRLYFLFMPFMALNMVFSVYFTSMEQPSPSQVISFLRGALLSIPLLFAVYLFRSLNGIWLAIPAAEMMTATIAVVYYCILKPHALYVYRYTPKGVSKSGEHNISQ